MLGSLWDQFGISLGSFWDQFGIILGSCWDQFGIMLVSFWDRDGIIVASLWDHFAIILESCGHHFCNDFGIMFGSLGIILGSFFEHCLFEGLDATRDGGGELLIYIHRERIKARFGRKGGLRK